MNRGTWIMIFLGAMIALIIMVSLLTWKVTVMILLLFGGYMFLRKVSEQTG